MKKHPLVQNRENITQMIMKLNFNTSISLLLWKIFCKKISIYSILMYEGGSNLEVYNCFIVPMKWRFPNAIRLIELLKLLILKWLRWFLHGISMVMVMVISMVIFNPVDVFRRCSKLNLGPFWVQFNSYHFTQADNSSTFYTYFLELDLDLDNTF